MPLRQFVWRWDEGRGINLRKYAVGTFDVVDLSSIRFPKQIIFEDIFILNRDARAQCTVHLDVSDLDGNDLKIKNSDNCVFVEGKREEFDGRSWIQNQICRRLPLPQGYKVKSVRSKRLGYGLLTLTVNMKRIGEADEEPSPVIKTVLLCEAVLREAITFAGPIKIKLAKIQPKIVSCALDKPPQLERKYLQPSHQFEEPVAQNVPSTSGIKSYSQVQARLACNKNIVELHKKQKSDEEVGEVVTAPELLRSEEEETVSKKFASESDDIEELSDSVAQTTCRHPTFDYQIGPLISKRLLGMNIKGNMNLRGKLPTRSRQSVENSDEEEAFSRKLAQNESDEHEEPNDTEVLTTENRHPTLDPKTVLATIAQDEVKIDLDWEEEEKAHVSKYFKCVY